jgi:rhamnogalacturonan endolyase
VQQTQVATNESALLTISLAGYSSGTSAEVYINGEKLGSLVPSSIIGEGSSYRAATLEGEWHLLQFTIPASALKVTGNALDIKVTSASDFRGWIYDSLLLEWL